MDSTLLPFALLCFTSFFTLTNPLGTMPVFLTMTHGMTDKERQAIAPCHHRVVYNVDGVCLCRAVPFQILRYLYQWFPYCRWSNYL